MEDKPLRVVKLTAENIKRISAVEITPTGDVIVIGGKNGAGKSSVLDSIAYALGGQKLVAAQPVRRGQEKGRVRVDLGDIVVTRSFTATGGGQLVVSDKDGKRQTSPQAILDRLVGRLSFDPLAFATMDPAKQRDTLREIAGLDLTDLDAQRVALYEKR
ncbi:MAG: ATP-binding protein, partial [Actinobacteria bacterium]|nr:ATP-binding protein [Actinomycetota bacterium]